LVITAPFTNPYSAVVGSSVTFNITVNSTGVGIPTGTVTFSTGSTTLGVVTLAPATGGTFQATLSTTALPVGTDVVYIVYSGDANYQRSAVSGTVIVVSTAELAETASGTTLTSSISNDSTITFTDTPYGGWQGVVGYQCVTSSLPANAICVFSPGQVTVRASTPGAPYPPATTVLKVVVNNPPNSPATSSMLWWLGGLTGLLLLWTRRRMTRGAWGAITMLAGLILLAGAATGLMACNSGIAFATPAGTSTVTVYASADPYLSVANNTTQSCGIIPGSTPPTASPKLAPCSQQTFQVSLTVQ
jgi:hypothetical protein